MGSSIALTRFQRLDGAEAGREPVSPLSGCQTLPFGTLMQPLISCPGQPDGNYLGRRSRQLPRCDRRRSRPRVLILLVLTRAYLDSKRRLPSLLSEQFDVAVFAPCGAARRPTTRATWRFATDHAHIGLWRRCWFCGEFATSVFICASLSSGLNSGAGDRPASPAVSCHDAKIACSPGVCGSIAPASVPERRNEDDVTEHVSGNRRSGTEAGAIRSHKH